MSTMTCCIGLQGSREIINGWSYCRQWQVILVIKIFLKLSLINFIFHKAMLMMWSFKGRWLVSGLGF
ncbi:hypothetical protein BKX93_13800 [Chromobacterium vaccinii]|uniref:Uncharacterized protein n=1 Tax=Chromobacterium vaccinii TaxID=1108595 RepID=A0A1D9LI52_9NEIS|nr:hypothetical protein BKX93_13800 [Chromobacterium vaccinii]